MSFVPAGQELIAEILPSVCPRSAGPLAGKESPGYSLGVGIVVTND